MQLPAEKAEKAAGKGLLIAGIRPEHFEDASVKADKGEGSTFHAKVDVVEWLGNEAYAYIPFEAPPEVQAQLQQLERDLDGDTLHTQLVVSLDGASRVAEGDDAEIWVDSSKMHLFDPRPGEPHRGPQQRRADRAARRRTGREGARRHLTPRSRRPDHQQASSKP